MTFACYRKKEKEKMENMKSGRDDLAGGADSAAFGITKKHVDPFPLTKNFKTGQNNGQRRSQYLRPINCYRHAEMHKQ